MNMPAALFFFFLFTTCFTLLSCGDCSRKIDCPGYKDAVLDAWFPYRDNQRLIFLNSANKADTFTLKNTETTEPYQASSGIYGPAPFCEARKTFSSVELDALKRNTMNIELYSAKNDRRAHFFLGDDSFNVYDVAEDSLGQLAFGQRPASLQQLPSVTLGNRTLTGVVAAAIDTTNLASGRLYKLYFQKGEGLVAYSEYPSLITWVKQ